VEVIERFVKAQLVAELSQRRPSVTIPSLVERVVPHAAVFARRARSTLIRKVGDACRMIAECDRATFSYQPPVNNEPAVMHLLRTPETNDPRGRTQAYQALARRPGTSRRATVVDPLQPDLFAELEVGEDVGGADETQGGRGES